MSAVKKNQKQTIQQLDQLIAEYRELQEKITPYIERMEQIEEAFRELPQDTYDTKEGTVMVSANRRFNANDAMDLLSERSLQKVLVQKIDARQVAAQFPGIYRKSQRVYPNRVEIQPRPVLRAL